MPQEPDRYDLDDMMDRLKQRSTSDSQEEGELVTRADGSQAVRVRRRKRRSHQPHKERKRRIRMLQVSAVLVLILLLILAAGFVTIYVNTAPFRKQVVRKMAVGTGAEAKLLQFRMNPIGANAQGVDMNWPEGNVLDSLSLRILRADVSPFAVLSGKISGDALSAHTGKLIVSLPQEGKSRRVKPAPDGENPIHFKQCGINNLQIHFQSPGAGSCRLMGSEVTFKPAQDGQRALLRMTRGELRAHNWPLLQLDRAYIEFEGEQMDVIGASFRHEKDERGALELVGLVAPYDAEAPSSLDCTADSFLLSGLIGNSLGKLIEGRVDSDPEMGESKLTLAFDPQSGMQLAMGFRASVDEPFVLENFPMLFALSQILGDEWVSKPDFGDHASGLLIRKGDRIELRQLDMQTKNRMAIRGKLQQKSGSLSGEFEIGLAPGVIQVAENRALDAMFGDLREGYRWVRIDISGSVDAPVDNFSQLYTQALNGLKRQSEPSPESAGAPAGDSFDELTRPR